MKVLGVKQFHQMRFKLLDLSGSPFQGVLGKVPKNFIAVVYGFSGNGKTEFCVRLAKELCNHGKVAWLGYEQRHGSDFQEATRRNKMDEVTGSFFPIDPIAGTEGVSLLQDLDDYLKKRNSPDFIFIDSVDYTGFTWDEYLFLKNKYGNRKAFIFTAHSTKSGALKKAISERIVFDGGLGIFVSSYIAQPIKNRFGGFEPFVVWEERAMLQNPAFFPKASTGKRAKSASKQVPLFAETSPEVEEEFTKIALEERGVRAEFSTKTRG